MGDLLLTGTITPNPRISKNGYKSTTIQPNERLKQYIYTIFFYITNPNIKNIVFCENSGYNCAELIESLTFIANNIYGKNFEFISFHGNEEETIKRSIGFGDGECIDYAFKKSLILRNSKYRYKVTGRYIIYNINDIISESREGKSLFFRRMQYNQFRQINTAFFGITNETYKYFYDAKSLTGPQKGGIISLENVYYHIYSKHSSKINVSNLKTLPNDNIYKIKRYHYLSYYLGLRSMNSQTSKILDKIVNKFIQEKYK